jgi:hypothetical protein
MGSRNKGPIKTNAAGQPNRDPGGRFPSGASGNPRGRPLGSRNRAGLVVEGLLDRQAEALGKKIIRLALAGNVVALRLCLERLLPARKEREMLLQLPSPATPRDILAGFGTVVEALTHGELTPSETNTAAALLESARRALETTELARRVEDLENRLQEAEQHGIKR